ncbi:MAG: DNA cytosine methyltransferase [Ktedonobacteraceae bacterium]|nr:DNA cytosine methyltransferase [Ktedonobacteraceae bacterium]
MATHFYWDQDLTATDFFCGAGAFGSGVEHGGAVLNLAVNHDPRSIETHRQNFPRAKHLCMRMEDVDFVQECDSLLGTGSPECRFQTPAAGEKLNGQGQLAMWTDHDDKPHVEQSRMSMWQVYRAAAAKVEKGTPYHSMIFENVTEVASKWGDYKDWKKKMQALGYECQELYLCAMFFDVCQRRDRWIGIFWRKGAKRPDLEFRPLVICAYCEREVRAVQCFKNPTKKWGKYDYTGKGQYTYNCPYCSRRVFPPYRAAAAVIDYADRGIRIRDRQDYGLPVLEDTTLQRIELGIDRFVKHQQVPPASAQGIPSLEGPLPFWVTYYSNGKPYSIFEPFCTFSTVARCGIVFPPRSGSLDIQECSFRMLNESEVRGGSGLPANYIIAADTKEELIRQCGHMVPPPMATWVTQRVIAAI